MTTIFKKGWIFPLTGIFCSLLLLSACKPAETTEEAIERRVNERWALLIAEDYGSAYKYLSPGYRSSVSIAQYQRALYSSKISWTAAMYDGSECSEDTCKVKILLDFTVYGALPGVNSMDSSQQIEESWVKIDNDWYHVPEK